MAAKLPVSLFDAADLPSPERFAAWRESIGVFLDVSLLRPGDEERYDCWAESYLVDDLVLSRCAANAQKFDRRPLRVAQDSIDHYMIQLLVEGTIDMALARRSLSFPSGQLIAFDLADTMDTVNSDFDLVSVIIPRRRLAPLLARPDSLNGAAVDPLSGTGRLLAACLASLYQSAPQLSTAEASAAAVALIDLIALAFNGVDPAGGDVPVAAGRAELLRVQNFVKAHLAAPTLGPDMIAAALGISRARLYRLFAPIGGIAEYVREQRLRRCLGDLVSAKQAHRQVAEIAYAWGFSDPTHFARAFKQRFGRTPSEVRRAAPPLARRDRPSLDPRVGDRLHEEWLAGLG
ncbi:helix-turn-helix domain-containing protein [Rhodoplanes sp. TEM]|uniref:Helix-turn-helix domain-containing protein n=1 Tax=Rhodoplanes tepidamans TaxID=200616 RepID=A0ABT5JD73_RHOTP|nr:MULTISPECIES: helix-turn-helix domain-containing protein [Rhodoplanes]MDC7787311.1 helix-turn-helix domain-containing protein [Rhodoplanes tepidamans]MDC7986899.1 helix-turn-helix domain-containing protein [Rhodoplanes sp. TEM]MDQ0358222.1 AraC-like DNA-binding protein [Rhodoplanes tepidamans]